MGENTKGEVPEALRAALPHIAEKWWSLPPEVRSEILAHANTFLALISAGELEEVSESTKSLADSSARIERLTTRLIALTRSLGWLTGLLVAETVALILLTLYAVAR